MAWDPLAGDLLRTLREEAQLTQEDLAEQLGRTKSAVSRYEAGTREPSLASLEVIVAKLGVSMETFHRRLRVLRDRESKAAS